MIDDMIVAVSQFDSDGERWRAVNRATQPMGQFA
jgi:hypothetical protein